MPGSWLRVSSLGRLARWTVAAVAIGGASLDLNAESHSRRIVSLGGSVTETVFALGAGADVIAVDQSSLFPEQVRALPQVGYFRRLSAEGVLSLAPDLILASEGSGPPPVIDQLEDSGVRIVWVEDGYGPDAAIGKIRTVARELGLEERGQELENRIISQIGEAEDLRKLIVEVPRVAFIWGHGAGGVTMAGSGTGAAVMIDLAGAENAASSMQGYQPISAEALVLAAPDAYVIPETTLASLGGFEGMMRLPGISATPAGRSKRVVEVDLLGFIGFGPRVGDSLIDLMRELHPELKRDVPRR